MTLEHSMSLDRSKAGAFNTLDAPLYLTRGSAHFNSFRHAVTGATRQGRTPSMGARIRKDDDHDLRHAPQRSATGKTNYSLPDHEGGGGGTEEETTKRTHVLTPSILALASIIPSTS